jgi:hypothetical protein
MPNTKTLTVQQSALGELQRYGALVASRHALGADGRRMFSQRTLDALVDAGHARYEVVRGAPGAPAVAAGIVPIDAPPPKLPCGGRAGDRLHHDDGTPRGTAQSADGRELEWFDAHAKDHHTTHHGWGAHSGRHAPRTITFEGLMHAAVNDGDHHCYLCGQGVRTIGLGTVVHADGHRAARTPAVVLAARTLVADWQQRAAELSVERDENTHDPNAETDDAIAETYADLAAALDRTLTNTDD